MTDDPIVAEVRKAREILESYGWDYRRMLADAMKRERECGRPVVSRRKEEPQPGVAQDVYGATSHRTRPAPGRDAGGPSDAGEAER